MTERIVIRVDADHELGLAHAVRTSRLFAHLSVPVEPVVIGRGGDLLADFFPGARLAPLADDADAEAERAMIAAEAAGGATMLLCDCPHMENDVRVTARDRLGLTVVAVDDYGGPVVADLVINGTALDAYHRYPALPPGTRVMAGAAYALIDPAFGRSRWHGADDGGVTIVAGGGDRATNWALALAGGDIDLERWGHLRFVVGRSFPERDRLTAAVAAFGATVEQGLAAEDLADRLARSTAALITGGMIVYECLALGVSAVVFPQERNLTDEAAWFEGQGACVDLGYDGGMDLGRADATVRGLLADADRRVAMSAAGRAIVDGRGLERAARAVDALLGAGAPRVAQA